MKRQPTKVTRQPHLWIHNLVAQDRRLNSSCKVVIMMLAMHADNSTQVCYPSLDLLSKECQLEQRTIRASLQKLESCGYISIEPNVGFVNRYTLLEPLPNKYNAPTVEDETHCDTPSKNEGGTNGTDPSPQKALPLPPQNHTTNNTNRTIRNNNTYSEEKSSQKEEIPFDTSAYIRMLASSGRPQSEVVAAFWTEKKFDFATKKIAEAELVRDFAPIKRYALTEYPLEKVISVIHWLKINADYKWGLETVGKYINEDLGQLDKDIASKGKFKEKICIIN